MKTKTKFVEEFQNVKRVSTPLVVVTTADQQASMFAITSVFEKFPVVRWDVSNGFSAFTEEGAKAVQNIRGDRDPSDTIKNLDEALGLMLKLPAKSIVFFPNAHLYLETQPENRVFASQGISNLRDPFKSNNRTFVMFAPAIRLPAELANDVIIINEPLPDDETIERIVREQFEATKIEVPTNGRLMSALDALRGLAAFQTEQVTAMALNPKLEDKFDLDLMWREKRILIESTKGLKIYRGNEAFGELAGIDAFVKFGKDVANSRPEARPNVVVWIDEIEKQVAGSVGDTSGVAQDQMGQILTWVQETKALGCLSTGHAGTGKSHSAKALANLLDALCIQLDLGAMKGSLVGESEQAIRKALNVIEAISGGRALIIATSNKVDVLTPEMRRRLSFAEYYFDLPSDVEVEAIRKIYEKKYDLQGQEWPDMSGWTGAEIAQCAYKAWMFRISPVEAGKYTVPMSVSQPEAIQASRKAATKRFLSAAYEGMYRGVEEKIQTALPRRMVN